MAITQIKTTGLADDAVTSAKIADDAVVTAALADDAVTGANIADDTVAEANMANDAISLAELKAGTDGQIISWDASGNPTAIGPGTDGQVLTSTGAGSPPAFEAIPAGGATINNATANEVVTVASTTTQLDAEANLTFDGNHLTLGDGDLVIGTSGHGIDFSAGAHATNMSSELLDDYEEGEFTCTYTATSGGTLSINSDDHLKYTKIGNRVFVSGMLGCDGHSSATGQFKINGLPFTLINEGEASNAHHIGYCYFRGGDSTPGSTGNYGEFAVLCTVPANQSYVQLKAIYGGLTDSGSQDVAQYVGESTFVSLNFSYVTP